MAVATLDALHYGCVTKPGTLLISTWLDALYDALLGTVYDDGKAVPANAQWLVGRFQNLGVTEAVYFTPAAGSAREGDFVIIVAGAAAGTHASVVMASPDVYANGVINIGACVATPGSPVGLANFSSWDGAAPFNIGRFTGYTRVYSGAAWNNCKLFSSAEHVGIQVETMTGTVASCWAGAEFLAATDDLSDSEGGDGWVFGFGTTGSAQVTPSDAWNTSATTGGWFIHLATASEGHFWYLAPGTSTIRAAAHRGNTSNGGVNESAATAMLSLSGAAVVKPMMVRDDSGGVTDGRYVGTDRAFFFGPQAISGTVLESGGVKSWLEFGYHTGASGDAAAMPY